MRRTAQTALGVPTTIDPSDAPPMMMNFDASQREACMVRENRTNTPLQALNLMNDVAFLEASRKLAERMMREGGATAGARLGYGWKLPLELRLRLQDERAVLFDASGRAITIGSRL